MANINIKDLFLEERIRSNLTRAFPHSEVKVRSMYFPRKLEREFIIKVENGEYTKVYRTSHSDIFWSEEEIQHFINSIIENFTNTEPEEDSPTKKEFVAYTCKFCGSPLDFKDGKFTCHHCGRIYYEK